MNEISVIVTVGPGEAYKHFLSECLESIHVQGEIVDSVVLVDDAAHLKLMELPDLRKLNYISNPWNLGQAASLNIGIANAPQDLVFVLGGCDDVLLSGCIQTCYDEYVRLGEKRVCYFPIITGFDGPMEVANLAQGVWLIHKREVWARLGGYPKEAITEVDCCFASIMLKQGIKMVCCGDEPLYKHREHPGSLDAQKSHLRREIGGYIRTMVTQEWQPPYWIEGFGYENL